jgi:hypothetical protein
VYGIGGVGVLVGVGLVVLRVVGVGVDCVVVCVVGG